MVSQTLSVLHIVYRKLVVNRELGHMLVQFEKRLFIVPLNEMSKSNRYL
jgi:hypothetical protein